MTSASEWPEGHIVDNPAAEPAVVRGLCTTLALVVSEVWEHLDALATPTHQSLLVKSTLADEVLPALSSLATTIKAWEDAT